MAGTSPAKTKSAGRFAPLSGRKMFPGQPCAFAGVTVGPIAGQFVDPSAIFGSLLEV
jgi:hypothetical protein